MDKPAANLLLKLTNLSSSLILPRTCRVCGAFDYWLCPACLRRVKLARDQRCLVCNKKSPSGFVHAKCVSRNTADGVIAAADFRQIKPLVHSYKYGLIKELSIPLAETILRYLQARKLEEFAAQKTLVPVPLHKSRLRFRGFNQSELLANALSRALGADVDAKLITRVKKTDPQVKQNREKREKNIKNAFLIASPQIVRGKDILLVDDIATTGTTLNECARVLKQAGAKSVWAIVLAHD